MSNDVIDMPLADVEEVTGAGALALNKGPASALQTANSELEGLDDIQEWTPRVALTQGQFMFKHGPLQGTVRAKLEIQVVAGRSCLEYYDEKGEMGPPETYYVSYDGGKLTTKGESFEPYLAQARQKYEIDWYEDDPTNPGEKVLYQWSLAPTGVSNFKKFLNELFKKKGKRVADITLVVTGKITTNKKGQVYTLPVFHCAELDNLPK